MIAQHKTRRHLYRKLLVAMTLVAGTVVMPTSPADAHPHSYSFCTATHFHGVGQAGYYSTTYSSDPDCFTVGAGTGGGAWEALSGSYASWVGPSYTNTLDSLYCTASNCGATYHIP